MEYIYGRKPVIEALSGPRCVHRVLLAEGVATSSIITDLVARAAKRDVPTRKTSKDDLASLIGDVSHQGVVAEVGPFKYADVDDLTAAAALKKKALIVVLDGVEDPQNLGAIIRTAAAAGADGVIVPKHGAAPVTAAVVKSSAGTVEHAAVAATNPNNAIDKLKEAGFWIVGADVGATDLIWDIDLAEKIALVFGGESRGLSRLVKSKCDFLAKLPLATPVESLNVSAAAAVMVYEAIRQRR